MKKSIPALAEIELTPVVALAQLVRMPSHEISALIARLHTGTMDANFFMAQYQIFATLGNQEFALEMQAKALTMSTVYRIAGTEKPTIRLLALMGAGDATDNTPLDYLLENTDIRLDLLYILPGHPLPKTIPDHDIAIVALGESGKNRLALDTLNKLLLNWPRPVLNQPKQILCCARDALYQYLHTIPQLAISPTLRISKRELLELIHNERPVHSLFGDVARPITIRPIDTQGGKGLSKIADLLDLAEYMNTADAEEFYVSCFIDYRNADGLYRKARVALIDGEPYICHLAISEQWIVHYHSANMIEDAAKREEEAHFMHDFETGFGLRHRDAFHAIAAQMTLDYVVIDCAETCDGKLLVFEADNRSWVHAADPVDIFPYKPAIMNKAFNAFRNMLLKHITSPHQS